MKNRFKHLGEQANARLFAEAGGMVGAAYRRKKHLRALAQELAEASVVALSNYQGMAHNLGFDLKYPERHLWEISALPERILITRQNHVGPSTVFNAEVCVIEGSISVTCPGVVEGHVTPMVFLEKLADFLADDLLR